MIQWSTAAVMRKVTIQYPTPLTEILNECDEDLHSRCCRTRAVSENFRGTQVSIDATDGVRVNNAKVVKADIEASNGVIHVIDTVIIPKE